MPERVFRVYPFEYFAGPSLASTMLGEAGANIRRMQNKRKTGVMIVTNDPIMRDGLRLCVRREPDMYVVCESCGVAQTIRDFRLYKPDIALIDLQLPRGAGRRAVRAVRAISAQTPVVVLTNYPGDLDTSPRTGEGVTLIVSKTFVKEQVIDAIRKAVAGVRS